MVHSRSYYDNKRSGKRIVINQGGTRSGKTYSILKVLCEYCWTNKNCGAVVTVVRKTLPALRGSAYRDFLEILVTEDWYSEQYHNKSEMTYQLFGNLIEFISVDQPQKIRGRKRNVCFINEANELTWEDFFQLNIRTTDKIIIDYNPSDEFHWIYDKLIPRDDADFFVTTYKDNPFLQTELIEEIERLQEADENHWQVYGLGQRGASKEMIYTHWQLIKEMPEGETWYGLDFGYNNPSALIKIVYYEGRIYADEMLYQTKLTTNDLAERLKEFGISKVDEIFCDNAEPKTIEELYRAGFNAKPCDKKEVKEGIRKVKSLPLFITERSSNMIKEIKSYKWKVDKDEHVLDEPVKFNDHAMDAMRYAVFTKLAAPKFEVAVW